MTLVDGLLMILALMAWVGGLAWDAAAKRTFLQSWLMWSALITGGMMLLIWRLTGTWESVLSMLVAGPVLVFFRMLRYGGGARFSEELRAWRDR